MAVQTTTQSRAVRRVHGGRNAGRSLVRRGRVERRNRCGEDQTVERQRSVACEALVRIRFARYGRIHSPFYRVVAIDSRKKRSGRPAEFLGWYNPMTKETQLDAPNIRKWLENGAQPTDTVRRLLAKALIIDASQVPERKYTVVKKEDATDDSNSASGDESEASGADE